MESEIDFAPLLLVSALAFVIPIATHRLSAGKVPSVVGEIAAGIVFGQTALAVIDANVWLEFLSLFGFAYLMFLAGLEVDTPLLVRPLGPRWYNPRVALRHPLVSGVLMLVLALVISALGVALIQSWGLVEDFWLLFFVFSATAVGVIASLCNRGAEIVRDLLNDLQRHTNHQYRDHDRAPCPHEALAATRTTVLVRDPHNLPD